MVVSDGDGVIMPDDILLQRNGAVVHVVFNAPARRNALSRTMLAELTRTVTELPEGTTGVVVSGSDHAFSAGADFRELAGNSADLNYDASVAEASDAIRRAPVPVVAAMEGPCIGAAVDLALACDLRVGGESSFVQVPAVALGLLYNPASVARWRSRLSDDTLRRLLLFGERLDAADAHRVGVLSHLVPRTEALQHATVLLEDLNDRSLDALRATKSLLQELDSGQTDTDRWFGIRRELLDSPRRQAAVADAKRTHTKDS